MNMSLIPQTDHVDQKTAEVCCNIQHASLDITVLSDGYISVSVETTVLDALSVQRTSILERLSSRAGLVDPNTNLPLIRVGGDVIIVDIGAGSKYQSSDGKLSANLAAAAIDPKAVTKVAFTHADPDHIWGTLNDDGSLRFPNATYYVGKAEWEFWMDKDYQTNMPGVLHDFARGAQRDLGAIADRVILLKPGDDVVTGMQALDTAGHTPGHLSFELSGGDSLILTADAATNQIVRDDH